MEGPDYFLINPRLGIVRDNLRIEAFVRNLLQEEIEVDFDDRA